MTPSAWVALATTLLFWASAFAGIRAGIRAYSPFHYALVRFITASLVLALCAAWRGVRKPARQDLPRLALIGLLGITLYHLSLNAGERKVSAGAASFLINTAPLFTVLWASLLLKERVGKRLALGLAISFAGSAIIARGEGGPGHWSPEALLILVAALCHSVFIVLQKPLLEKYHPLEIACYAVWAGTLFLLPFAGGLLHAIQQAPAAATWAGVYLGVFPAAVSFIGWAYVLSRISAARAAAFLYLIPPFALAIAWLWLSEIPSLTSIFGGALTLAGVALGNWQAE